MGYIVFILIIMGNKDRHHFSNQAFTSEAELLVLLNLGLDFFAFHLLSFLFFIFCCHSHSIGKTFYVLFHVTLLLCSWNASRSQLDRCLKFTASQANRVFWKPVKMLLKSLRLVEWFAAWWYCYGDRRCHEVPQAWERCLAPKWYLKCQGRSYPRV